MASETWRVVLASGEVREVRVEALDNGGFEARWGDCDVESYDSEHDAVLWLASCFSWGAVEILATNELTRAEAIAAARHDGAESMRAAILAALHQSLSGDQLRAIRAAEIDGGAR